MKLSVEHDQIVLSADSAEDGYLLGRIAAKLDADAYDYEGCKKLRINFSKLIEALAK